MVAPTSRLQKASFRGVIFYIDDSSRDGGRKTVTHEYPNQDTRDVEDLGLFPSVFKVKGIITGTSYFSDRDALISALEQAGEGTLVHPWYGSLQVTAKPYSITESITNFGEAIFSLTFEISSPIVQPSPTNFNLPSIATLAEIALGIAQGDFSSLFELFYNSGSNYIDAVTKARNISGIIGQIAGVSVSDSSSTTALNQSITSYNDAVNEAVANPPLLASNINELLSSFNDYALTPEQGVRINAPLFLFGSDDAVIPYDFYLSQERKKNREVVNNYVWYITLVNSYTNSAQIEYQNETQLIDTRNALDEQYQKIALSEILTANTLSAIKDLRTQMNIFFNNVQISLPKIEVVQTNIMPLTVFTYSYYGNTDQLNNIFYFNEFFNPSVVSGDISIFTGS